MKLQRVTNRIVRALLATPVISRGIGRRLVTVYVVGRKSGKQYTVPVAYTSHDGKLLIGTPFGWGKNLRTGESVEIRLMGRRRPADVEAFTDEPSVVEHYAVICRDNKQFASFNKIGIGSDGTPDPDDLHTAFTAGARSILLTPR
ncbi:nitroreductase family deazaflavin-dependent oxidoreductase [Streptomyces sp. SID6673]|nr:nitroreductase family deazaflavin-dependent oxidoreductase [Streptomyces sp. SID11726]NEB25332.1 nitroreductase family deazaflavin-dependent oxidoreductase [Streptomyces sp. SID6673]